MIINMVSGGSDGVQLPAIPNEEANQWSIRSGYSAIDSNLELVEGSGWDPDNVVWSSSDTPENTTILGQQDGDPDLNAEGKPLAWGSSQLLRGYAAWSNQGRLILGRMSEVTPTGTFVKGDSNGVTFSAVSGWPYSIPNIDVAMEVTPSYNEGHVTTNKNISITIPKEKFARFLSTINPGTTSKNIIPANVVTSNSAVLNGDSNLTSANIISGKSIFGVTGSATTVKSLSVTVVNNTSMSIDLKYADTTGNYTSGVLSTSTKTAYINVLTNGPLYLRGRTNNISMTPTINNSSAVVLIETGGHYASSSNSKAYCIYSILKDVTITLS